MTKQEILSQYSVDSYGLITNPGKFEREPIHAVYFYDAWMNGDGDKVGDIPTMGRIDAMFAPTDEDKALFPSLSNVECAVLTETDDGFIHYSECTLDEWNHFAEEQSLAMDESDEEGIES